MDENLNEQNQPKTYGDESPVYESGQQQENSYNSQPNYNQPNYNGQPNYNQPNYNGQPNYSQPYNNGYYGAPQIQHGPVKDVFCMILLVIMPLRIILGWISNGMMFASMDYDSIMDGSYMAIVAQPGFMVLSLLSSLVGVAFIVFIILDIVTVYKGNYKITGLILFGIFLNAGYYIWRAHVLGRKKTIPIVYTVLYSILRIAYTIYVFFVMFQMVFGMMQTLPM